MSRINIMTYLIMVAAGMLSTSSSFAFPVNTNSGNQYIVPGSQVRGALDNSITVDGSQVRGALYNNGVGGSGTVTVVPSQVLCQNPTSAAPLTAATNSQWPYVASLSVDNSRINNLCTGVTYYVDYHCYTRISSNGDPNPCPGSECDQSVYIYGNGSQQLTSYWYQIGDSDGATGERTGTFAVFYPYNTNKLLDSVTVQGENVYSKLTSCTFEIYNPSPSLPW